MCGICGSTNDPGGSAVAAMNAALVHRGPDDEGIYRDETIGLTLGARRLSIIDVTHGHQPVTNENETVWAVLNGEIYNHPSLQKSLRERGHEFRSGTDTEVLVHLYEEYGDNLVHALDGMYAFAVWDSRQRRLLVARDRFGEKPLFYHESTGNLTFASEMTALLAGAPTERELDPEAVDAYFVLGYVPGPGTMLAGVHQLPPAHLMTWAPGASAARVRAYWEPADLVAGMAEPVQQLAEETARLLRASVRSRMISDVPLGVLLSGGIDSSLIAKLAAEVSSSPIQTFTVGYDVGAVAETDGARRTAGEIGSHHHELVLREAEVPELAVRVLSGLDQPLADQALVATYAITRFARQHVTVAVGGEGADELFAGYPRYRWLQRGAQLTRLPAAPRRAAAELIPALSAGRRAARLAWVLKPQPTIERHVDFVTDGRRHLRPAFYGPGMAALSRAPLPRALSDRATAGFERGVPASVMRLDQTQWLPDDVLFKADRASMLNSLELRTPFLNRDLAEFAAGIPTEVHASGGGKRLLRMLGRELGISAAASAKTAFRVPASEWLRGALAPLVDEQLRTSAIFERELFDRDAVRSAFESHRAGATDWTRVLWPLLALGLWADRVWTTHGR